MNLLPSQIRKCPRKRVNSKFTLNEVLSINNDNRYVLEQWDMFYTTLKKAGQSVPIYTNRVEPIPSYKDALMNLGSIGLVNELFLLASTIRKLNDSMDTWQRSYQLARESFTANQINVATYVANVDRCNEGAILLTKFVDGLMEETMSALAATRLLIRDKPFFLKLYGWLNPDKYSQPDSRARAAEVQKLRVEVQEIGEASEKRISALTVGSTVPPARR